MFSLIQAKLDEELGIKFGIFSLVKNTFSEKALAYERYLAIFRRFRPRLIFYINDTRVGPVAEAAHDAGAIPVELQHGSLSPLNVTFAYHEAIPKDQLVKSNPDFVFTFGTFWDDRIRTPAKKIAVGFPYFEMMKTAPCKTEKDRCKNIVIIGDLVSKRNFVSLTLELSALLPDFRFYYKLRPDDYAGWQERYPEAFVLRSNITVIDNPQKSLYDYFPDCAYQIGESSTAIYEGLAMGLTTFILRTGWYQEMACLYENGYAFLVSDAAEIAEKIRSRSRVPRDFEIESIFKSGSLANAEKAVRLILQPGGAA